MRGFVLKYRAKFYRDKPVSFISHLDIMRVFERGMRRANIDMVYTEGFNPHPKMVFGLPLSVGIISETEYVDIELKEDIEPGEIKIKLNLNLPVGINVLTIDYNFSKTKIMPDIRAAKYSIVFELNDSTDFKKEDLESFMKKDEIVVLKKTKRGSKNIDIKTLIYDYSINEDINNKKLFLELLVSAGQVNNLKPKLLLDAFDFKTGEYEIYRKELFMELNKTLISPMDKRIIGHKGVK
jgi:radical SAM-linked protein